MTGVVMLLAVSGCAAGVVSPSATSGGGLAGSPPESSTVDEHAAAWTVTGAMVEARVLQTATLLSDGRVLVAGGSSACCSTGDDASASAELYEPTSGLWADTGMMIEARSGHTATLLPDGRVLVTGGSSTSGASGTVASVELYDPASGSWAATGGMTEARAGHTATLLPDGVVLVVGGSSNGGGTALASAELYDPSSGSWTATENMDAPRRGHTATLLPDGVVLVAGGLSASGASSTVASAELYDPSSGSWAGTGGMTEARAGHTATVLSGDKVLVAGGITSTYLPSALATAEIYDPSIGSWTAIESMDAVRAGHTASLLRDGTVLVAGAFSSGTDALASAEMYDPTSGSWTATGNMDAARAYHTATLLRDGTVLVAGGVGMNGTANALASAQLYDPESGS